MGRRPKPINEWYTFRNALQYSTNIEYTMNDIFKFKDVNLLFSVLVVIFAVIFIFNHPRFHMDNFSEGIEIHQSMLLLKMRFIVGIGLFAGIAIYCLPQMLHAPELLWSDILMKNEEAVVSGSDRRALHNMLRYCRGYLLRMYILILGRMTIN